MIFMLWSGYKVDNMISIEEIYSFFDMDYEENYDFCGETHNFWECVYVSKGEICVTADERVYNLTQNQMILHKPMEHHKFRVTSPGATLLVFSFSLSGALSGYFADKVFMLSQEQESLVRSMLEYAKAKATETGCEVTEKYLCAARNNSTYMQMIATYMYRLFLSLAENQTVADISHAPDAALFGLAVDYMNSNIDKTPSVTDVAAFLNISESGLKRIFFKYTGTGVHKYFVGLKIKAATQLLKNGVSVSQTATRLGFSSQGYFSRVYKRETGTAPKLQKG